ncbi:MAG: alpha/beta hydrolase [Brevirhabdus sp.]
MADGAADTSAGYTHHDLAYGVASQGGEAVELRAALYLPTSADTPPPLFVWFHGGAFKFGNYHQKLSRQMGRRLAQAGIAYASAQYRLRGEIADLSDQVASQYDRLWDLKAHLIRRGLCKAPSLVALEDAVRFLKWQGEHAGDFGWSGKVIVGGTSAGGITAFNTVFTAPELGLERPEISGVFATSGGYNFPSLVKTPLPVLAQHSPLDERVSIKGVRMLKDKLGDQMELLESDPMIHGHLDLVPGEKPRRIYERLVRFVRQATL